MTKITISEGASMKNPPANRNGSGDCSRTASTCAGSVGFRSVRIDAAKTSFQEIRKTKIAAAASPGSASGSAIRRNADEPAAAERHRGLFHLHGDAGEDARRHQDGEGKRQRRVREREPQHRVVDSPAQEHDRERDREDHDRERARAHDPEAERVAAAEREAGQRVPGRRPDPERKYERQRRRPSRCARASRRHPRTRGRSASSRSRRRVAGAASGTRRRRPASRTPRR